MNTLVIAIGSFLLTLEAAPVIGSLSMGGNISTQPGQYIPRSFTEGGAALLFWPPGWLIILAIGFGGAMLHWRVVPGHKRETVIIFFIPILAALVSPFIGLLLSLAVSALY